MLNFLKIIKQISELYRKHQPFRRLTVWRFAKWLNSPIFVLPVTISLPTICLMLRNISTNIGLSAKKTDTLSSLVSYRESEVLKR